MKKVLSLVLAFFMFTALLPAAGAAEIIGSGTCGEGLTWVLDSDGTLTISGVGEMKDYSIYRAPWEMIREKIRTIVFEEGVTSVGALAFYGCDNLTAVSMPKSVKRIEQGAFGECGKLKQISLEKGVESIGMSAFEYCAALTEIDIPEGVTMIDLYAFSRCVGLKEISIPKSVTEIGEGAFEGCVNLKEISVPEKLTNIGKNAFFNTMYYNDGKNWENGALYIGRVLMDTKREELHGRYAVKDGTENIVEQAFSDCSDLSGIEIPDSVIRIGRKAFSGCAGLSEITLPKSVVNIESEAFYDCTGLKKVSILGEKVKMGYCAFENCGNLSDVEISGSVAEMGNHAFSGTAYYDNEKNWENGALYVGKALVATKTGEVKGAYTVKKGTICIADNAFYGAELTSVTIPSETEYVPQGAFVGCEELTEINVESGCENYESHEGVLIGKRLKNVIRVPEGKTGRLVLPKGILKIDKWAFNECTKLEAVIIQEGVTEIGDRAFEGCVGLEEVILPESLKSMGDSVFDKCGKLESVVIPKNVESVGERAFYKCESLKSAEIEDGVKRIGNSAFYGCGKLEEIEIPGSVTEIGSGAFEFCTGLKRAVIEEGTVRIGLSAFYGCKSLTSVSLPDGLETMGLGIFSWCVNLKDVTIPKSVTRIGPSAFYNCESLTSISLPEGVETIEDNTFGECKSLTDVVIPSVKSIGNNAFDGCESLKNISFSKDISFVGKDAFINTAYYNDEKNWIDGVFCIGNVLAKADRDVISGVYKIRDGVTSISPYAFEWCRMMTGVEIPDSVTCIGKDAFYNSWYYDDDENWSGDVLYSGDILIGVNTKEAEGHCKIKNGTRMIADYAFAGAEKLEKISIPKSVKIIGDKAFLHPELRLDIYFEGTEKEWMEIEAKHNLYGDIKSVRIYYSCDFDGINVYLDGEKVEFDQEPIILEGRTLVPVRAVVESMGGTAEWDDASKTAALRFDGHEIKLTAKSTEASLDGETKTLDKAPEIIGERMLIPIRFVAESFGFEVYWDDEVKSVIIEG